jgi:hypothetical protein
MTCVCFAEASSSLGVTEPFLTQKTSFLLKVYRKIQKFGRPLVERTFSGNTVRVRREYTVLLVFPVEAGISWTVPELLYLRVLKNISKVTNSPVPAGIEKYFKSYKQSTNLAYQPFKKAYQNYESR